MRSGVHTSSGGWLKFRSRTYIFTLDSLVHQIFVTFAQISSLQQSEAMWNFLLACWPVCCGRCARPESIGQLHANWLQPVLEVPHSGHVPSHELLLALPIAAVQTLASTKRATVPSQILSSSLITSQGALRNVLEDLLRCLPVTLPLQQCQDQSKQLIYIFMGMADHEMEECCALKKTARHQVSQE